MRPKVRGPYIHWGLIYLIPGTGTWICSQNILQVCFGGFPRAFGNRLQGGAFYRWAVRAGWLLMLGWLRLAHRSHSYGVGWDSCFRTSQWKKKTFIWALLHHFEIKMGILKSVSSFPLIERDLAQISTWQNNTKLCVHYTLSLITTLWPFFPLPMNPSLSLSLSPCHLLLSCHFLPHSSTASTRSSSFGHTHTYTHTCSTDCLSSIFCSTLHHGMNRWITFPAPELCKNISPLWEWEGIKNVTTQALEATDQFSRSNAVWLVGIHPWLHWLNFCCHSFCLPAPLCPSQVG